MSNWKKTSELLPKDMEEVILNLGHSYCIAIYLGYKKLFRAPSDFDYKYFSIEEVKSWCEIPK